MTDFLIWCAFTYVLLAGLCLLGLLAEGPKALREEWWLPLVWPYICAYGFRCLFRDIRNNWRKDSRP
jgi:hypothetical protein